ncbi:MAG: hypothetical protein H0T71_14250, partial [Acidobacteria bacterium]|nr:hypothetical protein [Acidobacteriota bacterium]
GVASTPLPDVEEPLVDHDETDYAALAADESDPGSVTQRLGAMSVPDKVRAAMKGTREMRSVLIRDPNKLVALSVLSCPKVTDVEVESFARMGSVGEDVLRTIAQTRAWVKNYGVVLALVKNSKTPLAMTLTLLNRLNEGDVRRLSTDRNVPDPLRRAAKKKLSGGD